jgi:hypothetical protein
MVSGAGLSRGRETGWRPQARWAMVRPARAAARAATGCKEKTDAMRLFRPALAAASCIVLLVVAGCGGSEPRGRVETLPDPGLVFLEPPTRNRAFCVPVAPTELTRPFFVSGADLLACRSGYPPGFELVAQRGARQVARTTNYTLYSVPRPVAP